MNLIPGRAFRLAGRVVSSASILFICVAAKPVNPTIAPGPTFITDEEKAIVADPNHGAQHAVILVVESEMDDSQALPLVRFHLRAKILSNEGRGLADVEIPAFHAGGHLTQWWGRTLTPDGGVIEIPQDLLKDVVVESHGRWEDHSLRGALAGVEPGCVIDYGYTYRDTNFGLVKRLPHSLIQIALEWQWPVRHLWFRWNPAISAGAATVRRETDLAVSVTQEGKAFIVDARNLLAVPEEPAMPPKNEVHSVANLYYVFIPSKDVNDYWKTVGLWIEDAAKTFNSYIPPLDNAISEMNLPPDADLKTKLKGAYDWMTANLKDINLRTSEEMEIGWKERSGRLGTAGSVIKAKEGETLQLGLIYLGLARKLGAEAGLVLAADRTRSDWHPNLLSTEQFDEVLVAARTPGDPDEKMTIVDPSSGLPFGEIPWWVKGGKALMTTPTGSRQIDLKTATEEVNRAQIKSEITWGEEGEKRFRWSFSGSDQNGYQSRLQLRRALTDEKTRRLDELCGSGQGLEISHAEAPGLEDLTSSFRLLCEGKSNLPAIEPTADESDVGIAGPWIDTLPDLSASVRHHPVVFSYPRTEILALDVATPPGYKAGEPPAPVEISGPYGSYKLETTVDESGFHVRREFTLAVTRVDSRGYAGIQSFISRVKAADRTTLPFVKKGAAG